MKYNMITGDDLMPIVNHIEHNCLRIVIYVSLIIFLSLFFLNIQIFKEFPTSVTAAVPT